MVPSVRTVLVCLVLTILGVTAYRCPSEAGPYTPQQKQFGEQQKRAGCDTNRDFYARLQSYCNRHRSAIDSCCVDDDGVCLGVCEESTDSDCEVLSGLLRAHEFLLANKTADGFTPDSRDSLFSPRSEAYRLGPCMQALGYLNLYRHTGDRRFLKEATDRLDFLAAHLREAFVGSSYDAQLGRAFLEGYAVTCDRRYLDIGLEVADRPSGLESRVLNWGMLAALNLLHARELTGNEDYLSQARDIVSNTLVFQNADGSFPHQDVVGQRNLPYTSWLAHELVRYLEVDADVPGLAQTVDRSGVLLARQLLPDGSPRYDYDSLLVIRIPDPMCVLCSRMNVEGCDDYCAPICPTPGPRPCWCIKKPTKECPYVDSLVNITYADEQDPAYDVRGWTSELPSTAFVLSATGRLAEKWQVLRFLLSLQNPDGSFPDKWGYMPPPNQKFWVFASDTHSVVRTSCVFFYLSEILRAPETAERGGLAAIGAGVDNSGTGEKSSTLAAAPSQESRERAYEVIVRPTPSFGNVSVQFSSREFPVHITIVDVAGRTVRQLAEGLRSGGRLSWDGRDNGGRPVAPGVYFVKMVSPSFSVSSKVVLLRSE